ncbi:glycosyltransferase family 2 protein [Leptospira adleri]|uniref:Glycosyl transferase n=1 Tax=Leptospira adleri TaxID=2023186 RepID=A0A2M9YV15_9LEPT|nr:glycosyltransferase family 2 protein [Leptospira adleri]PJZ55326.1 glycosyl transferase [Leptospira adleri]PJZ59771.1 glycosyl transferase [Leptospira adleri]
MKQIKVSVITINYNNRDGLKKTILSVRNQSFENYEHIIIDAASTDGSVQVVEEFQDKIAYWVSEKDDGIYYAQNKGIRAAKGEFCLFLNSGDRLASETVLLDLFKRNFDEDLIYGDMFLELKDGKLLLRRQPKRMTLSHLLLDTIWHPACLIKRELFDRFGMYDTAYKMVADYEFWLRIYKTNQIKTKYLPVAFSIFNLDGLSSLPENQIRLNRERETAQSKYFSATELFFFRDFPGVFKRLNIFLRSVLRGIINLFPASNRFH